MSLASFNFETRSRDYLEMDTAWRYSVKQKISVTVFLAVLIIAVATCNIMWGCTMFKTLSPLSDLLPSLMSSGYSLMLTGCTITVLIFCLYMAILLYNQKALKAVAIIAVISMAGTAGSGIACYCYMDLTYHEELFNSSKGFPQNGLDLVQSTFQCCGWRNYSEWLSMNVDDHNLPCNDVPRSCCNMTAALEIHGMKDGDIACDQDIKMTRDYYCNEKDMETYFEVMNEFLYDDGCSDEIRIRVHQARGMLTITSFCFAIAQAIIQIVAVAVFFLIKKGRRPPPDQFIEVPDFIAPAPAEATTVF